MFGFLELAIQMGASMDDQFSRFRRGRTGTAGGAASGRHTRAVLVAALVAGMALPVLAQDTTSYTYDELGRLKTVTYGDGVSVVYEYDAAGNRTRQEVTGSTNAPPPAAAVIVLPIAGFTIIPIQ